jgi:hypothetical protein
MGKKANIFISYAWGSGDDKSALQLAAALLDAEYNVVSSKKKIIFGEDWQQSTFQDIRQSDLVLVLLNKPASSSEWVRREVDFARGANVSILPVQMKGENEAVYLALKSLSLQKMQFLVYDGEDSFNTLVDAINHLAEITRKNRGLNITNTEFEKLGFRFFEALQALDKQQTLVEGIKIKPIFGTPLDKKQFQCDIFVIMPFAPEFQPVYDHVIKPLEKELAINLEKGIKRGDDFFSHHNIVDEIWSAIYSCQIIIADCTGRNANVFYELGIAHTLGKPYILITQNVKDAPFDIQGRRLIEYKDSIAGTTKLKADLKKAIAALLADLDENG